jgi:hypothetical protein
MFNSAGFAIERLDWLEGYFGTVGYQLRGMSRYLPWRPGHLRLGLVGYPLVPAMLLLKATCKALSVCFHQLEMRSKFVAQGYPKNYVVIARKTAV